MYCAVCSEMYHPELSVWQVRIDNITTFQCKNRSGSTMVSEAENQTPGPLSNNNA